MIQFLLGVTDKTYFRHKSCFLDTFERSNCNIILLNLAIFNKIS